MARRKGASKTKNVAGKKSKSKTAKDDSDDKNIGIKNETTSSAKNAAKQLSAHATVTTKVAQSNESGNSNKNKSNNSNSKKSNNRDTIKSIAKNCDSNSMEMDESHKMKSSTAATAKTSTTTTTTKSISSNDKSKNKKLNHTDNSNHHATNNHNHFDNSNQSIHNQRNSTDINCKTASEKNDQQQQQQLILSSTSKSTTSTHRNTNNNNNNNSNNINNNNSSSSNISNNETQQSDKSNNNNNNNNNNDKEKISTTISPTSNGLKYLHKKFKRVASANVVETSNNANNISNTMSVSPSFPPPSSTAQQTIQSQNDVDDSSIIQRLNNNSNNGIIQNNNNNNNKNSSDFKKQHLNELIINKTHNQFNSDISNSNNSSQMQHIINNNNNNNNSNGKNFKLMNGDINNRYNNNNNNKNYNTTTEADNENDKRIFNSSVNIKEETIDDAFRTQYHQQQQGMPKIQDHKIRNRNTQTPPPFARNAGLLQDSKFNLIDDDAINNKTSRLTSANSNSIENQIEIQNMLLLLQKQQQQQQQLLLQQDLNYQQQQQQHLNFPSRSTLKALNKENNIDQLQFVQQQQLNAINKEQHANQNSNISAQLALAAASAAATTATSSPSTTTASVAGRHVCPYCNLNCTKPSVLQKHIRAHTNERPYPCDLCGFAFKTKSNYYKHCRSRSHAQRTKGVEPQQNEDDGSIGSDAEPDNDMSNSSSDVISGTASPLDERTLSPAVAVNLVQPQPIAMGNNPHQLAGLNLQHVISTALSSTATASAHRLPTNEKPFDKPYKPKFHKASLYTKDEQQHMIVEQQQQQKLFRPHQLVQQYHNQTQFLNDNEIKNQQLSNSNKAQKSQQSATPAPKNLFNINQNTGGANYYSQFLVQNHQTPLTAPPHNFKLDPQQQHAIYYCQPELYAKQIESAVGNNGSKSNLHLSQNNSQRSHSGTTNINYDSAGVGEGQPYNHHHSQHAAQPQQHYYQSQQRNSVPISSAPIMSGASQSQQQKLSTSSSMLFLSSSSSPSPSPSSSLSTLSSFQQVAAPPTASTSAPETMSKNSSLPSHHIHSDNLPSQSSASNSFQRINDATGSSKNNAGGSKNNRRNNGSITGANEINKNNFATNIGGGHQVDLEAVQEHITKLISQNQAIVGNKAEIFQKKYPKQLNKQKSLTNLIIPSSASMPSSILSASSSSSASSLDTPNTPATPNSSNAKLAFALATKQHLKQQQLQLQQQQQQAALQQTQPQLLQYQQEMSNRISNSYQPIPLTLPAPQKMPNSQSSPRSHTHSPLTNTSLHHSKTNSLESKPPSNLSQSSSQATIMVDFSSQPLNLSKSLSSESEREYAQTPDQQQSRNTPIRKRSIANVEDAAIPHSMPMHLPSSSPSIGSNAASSATTSKTPATHPKNPERSIIKNLLLNSRGLAIPTGEGDDAVYICPLCKLDFQTAEELKLHTSQYCEGGTPSSAPMSPVSASQQFYRSNSMSMNLQEFNNPNSLAKLAKSSLIHLSKNPKSLVKLCWSQLKTKPSNLVLTQLNLANGKDTTSEPNNNTNSNANVSSSSANEFRNSEPPMEPISLLSLSTQKLIDAPLPSPGPLLGKTPLVESYNERCERKHEDVVITKVHDESASSRSAFQYAKKFKFDSESASAADTSRYSRTELRSGSFDSHPIHHPRAQYMTSGGEILIVDNVAKPEEFELRQRFLSSGGCIVPIIENEQSPKIIRTPLLSGGSFTEVSPKPKDANESAAAQRPSSTPQNLDAIHSSHQKVVLGLPTPLSAIGLQTPNILNSSLPLAQHFQFPPINSITAFNPLTLPPLPMAQSPVLPSNEKIIPYVPGIPGPNTLSLPMQHIMQAPLASQQSKTLEYSNLVSPPMSNIQRKKSISPQVQGAVHSNYPSDGAAFSNLLRNMDEDYAAILTKPTHIYQKPLIRIEHSEKLHSKSHPSAFKSGHLNFANSTDFGKLTVPVPQHLTPTQHNNAKAGFQNSETVQSSKKSFSFTRMADNISPKKFEKTEKFNQNARPSSKSPDKEAREFQFEPDSRSTSKSDSNADENRSPSNGSLKSNTEQEMISQPTEADKPKRTKFLRPTSLPLKPGTFTPKRHHGITPTANTMPLISPETPRPSKTCGQMFLNGHAYTYLGLKCSTKMFYCTVNCPQPSYVANLHKLSMYSVWQVHTDKNLHPLGYKPKLAMDLYDSRQRNSSCTTATIKIPYTTVHSQHTVMTPFENNGGQYYHHQIKSIPMPSLSPNQVQVQKSVSAQSQMACTVTSSVSQSTPMISVCSPDTATTSSTNSKNENGQNKAPALVGGYESNEDYTYIRGRGRGRYVCSECGIRCKKPSMLKKHIRTHSDVRPYTCQHCNFSFKTKGNLTKHMQSKTHYKKCLEIGVDPGEGLNGEFVDHRENQDNDQQSITSSNGNGGGSNSGRTSTIPGESDSDGEDSDGDDRETESSDTDESKSRLPEHEAAKCLLSLSRTPPSNSVSPHLRYSSESYQLVQESNYEQQRNMPAAGFQKQKSIITSFTSPKPPFDYQKQEKYYSNPLIPKAEKLDDPGIVLDLTNKSASERTKKLSSNEKIAMWKEANIESQHATKPIDVIGNVNTNVSGLLKTLVSLADKVREVSAVETDFPHSVQKLEDSLLRPYLTEKALKHTKIKQSQMSKSFTENVYVHSPSAGQNSPNVEAIRAASQKTQNKVRLLPSQLSTNADLGNEINAPKTDNQLESAPILSHKEKDQLNKDSEKSQNAKSNKSAGSAPQTVPATIAVPSKGNSSKSTPSNNAQDVASEYLKMTLKSNQQQQKSVNSSAVDESEDENIEQEGTSTSNIGATSTTPSVAIPVSTALPTDFTGILARTVVVGEDGFKNLPPNPPSVQPPTTSASTTQLGSNQSSQSTNEIQPMFPRSGPISDEGRPVCNICSKTFQKQHQLVLHMNIHYMERKFKCEPCALGFRSQGHLQKHERSEGHKNKVMMTSAFGVPTTSNPRPYECSDCVVAFRIPGHLAKHLRSKTHVQKLECLQKLPFGTYAEIERKGISLTEIDTTDCDNSLASLKIIAQKLKDEDPTKLSSYTNPSGMDGNGKEANSSGCSNVNSAEQNNNDCSSDYNNELDSDPTGHSAYEEKNADVLSNESGKQNDANDNAEANVVVGDGGTKRKLQSERSERTTSNSSCSTNDSTLLSSNSEKRIRTSSDTK